MTPEELTKTDVERVRCLCAASREDAVAACADAREDDPAELHCARFALHIIMETPLPPGYVHEVLRASLFHTERNGCWTSLTAHVALMAMYAADLNAISPGFARFCRRDNQALMRAAAFRFARCREALDDEMLLAFSHSTDDNVRRGVARVLGNRACPCRNEILARLLDDPNRLVSSAATCAAARTGDPELVDLLASRGDLGVLLFTGDPRTRPGVEALVNCEDPLAGEEAVAGATALGDPQLLAKLWAHPEWDTRSNAILSSANKGLLETAAIDGILVGESPEHLAELVLRWPHIHPEGLVCLSRLLDACAGDLPNTDDLAAGQPAAVDRIRAWIPSAPMFCGAALRLLPEDSAISCARVLLDSADADARIVAVQAVAHRRLRACFARVAELCLDSHEAVAKEAARAVYMGPGQEMPCGLYGLDTAILRAANGNSESFTFQGSLQRPIEAILDGQIARDCREEERPSG